MTPRLQRCAIRTEPLHGVAINGNARAIARFEMRILRRLRESILAIIANDFDHGFGRVSDID
jgi:hypothetical protein